MIAFPVFVTTVDWNLFQRTVLQTLGRSVTASLDSKNMPPSIIPALAEFQYAGSDPVLSEREAGALLKYVSVGMLFLADNDVKYLLASEGKVAILDCEDKKIFIASATLEDWRTTVINFSTTRSSHEMRMINSIILAVLDKLGYSRIFENYRRDHSKGGLLLTRK